MVSLRGPVLVPFAPEYCIKMRSTLVGIFPVACVRAHRSRRAWTRGLRLHRSRHVHNGVPRIREQHGDIRMLGENVQGRIRVRCFEHTITELSERGDAESRTSGSSSTSSTNFRRPSARVVT